MWETSLLLEQGHWGLLNISSFIFSAASSTLFSCRMAQNDCAQAWQEITRTTGFSSSLGWFSSFSAVHDTCDPPPTTLPCYGWMDGIRVDFHPSILGSTQKGVSVPVSWSCNSSQESWTTLHASSLCRWTLPNPIQVFFWNNEKCASFLQNKECMRDWVSEWVSVCACDLWFITFPGWWDFLL